MKHIKYLLSSILVIIVLFGVLFTFLKTGSSSNSTNHSKKVVHILTYANWNPFEYVKNGKVIGFDIDLVKKLSAQAGYQYTIKNVSWDSMFTQLQGKQADVGISGITITSDRKKTFDFSQPYFVSRQSIVTKKNDNITSAKDLKGQNVVVQTGSTGQEAAQKLFGKNNSHILKSSSGVTYQMVLHGQAAAVIGDNTSNQRFVQANSQDHLKVVEDNKAFSPEYFGIMFPKGSKLRAKYNTALKKLISKGDYSKIYQKWFGVRPNTKELLSTHK